MAFIDYQGMLRGWCDQIDPNLAAQLINYAWRDIRDARTWSFLIEESAWVAAALINGGTVSVQNNVNTVTFDATAKALLNAAAANPPINTRQFRVINGLIYNIINYDTGTGVATLDRPFEETTNTTASFQVYKCYYEAPTFTANATDFNRLLSVVDPIFNRRLDLNKRRQYLDTIDPIRLQQLQPYIVVSYRDSTSIVAGSYTPRYEMWPHPTNAQAYNLIYLSRGVDFSADTDALPAPIPDELLMERAFYYGFRWQLGNASKSNMPPAALLQSIALSDANYKTRLQQVKLLDENIYVQNLQKRIRVSWVGGDLLQQSWPLAPRNY